MPLLVVEVQTAAQFGADRSKIQMLLRIVLVGVWGVLRHEFDQLLLHGTQIFQTGDGRAPDATHQAHRQSEIVDQDAQLGQLVHDAEAFLRSDARIEHELVGAQPLRGLGAEQGCGDGEEFLPHIGREIRLGDAFLGLLQ